MLVLFLANRLVTLAEGGGTGGCLIMVVLTVETVRWRPVVHECITIGNAEPASNVRFLCAPI